MSYNIVLQVSRIFPCFGIRNILYSTIYNAKKPSPGVICDKTF